MKYKKIETFVSKIMIAAVVLMCVTGCASIIDLISKINPDDIEDIIPDNPDNPEDAQADLKDAISLSEITWLGVDVSSWKKTYDLTVKLRGNNIVYDQEGTSKWTPKQEAGVMATANPWIIAKINGKWYAATHEWMRVNQREKGKRSVHGDHIKRREFGPDWTPTDGEEYGFMVSGLCRGTTRNVSERTPIVLMVWGDNASSTKPIWTNKSSGYRIRLKDYKNSPDRTHKGRKTSVKLDTRFHTEVGMHNGNTKVTADNGELEYYGIDAENGKHDLCFADKNRFPEQHNKPCYLKIYKNEKLHTVVKIDEWKYGTVLVEAKCEVPPVSNSRGK